MTRMSAAEYRLFLEREAQGRSGAGSRARENGKAWESRVTAWADAGGWRWWQPTPIAPAYGGPPMEPGRGSSVKRGGPAGRGALDLELVHRERMLYGRVELKSGKARLGKPDRLGAGGDQAGWVDDLRHVLFGLDRVFVAVWRDVDADDVRAFLLGPRLAPGGRVPDTIPGVYTV